MNQTIGESGLPFIEIIDKSTLKEQKNKKKEQEVPKNRERPSSVKITIGQNCYLPLEDQLFDDEKASLNVAKQLEVAKYFSDEFIVATLFAKKFDIKRTDEFLKNNLNWRRENGFMNIPKFSELDPRFIDFSLYLPGARDKLGRSLRYVRAAKRTPFQNGQTLDNITKWATWFHYVGIYHEGIDALRNGVCFVIQMEGFGWKNFDLDFHRQSTSTWIGRFPVLVRKIIVVNPPAIFTALRKMIATVLKSKLMERFEILQTTKELEKLVEPDNLIAEFGGNVNYSSQDWYKSLEEWAERCEERLIAPGRE